MREWTRRQTLATGTTLIILTHALALGGILGNRLGEPESRLTLSERELPLPYGHFRHPDDSALTLRLNWRVPANPDDVTEFDYATYNHQPAWMDATRMAELGFDTAAGHDTPEAREHFARQLPREVLIVLELAGPAWQQTRRQASERATRRAAEAASNPGKDFVQRAKSSRDLAAQEEVQNSRLFAVDADRDLVALRARHPDRRRTLVVRAQVRPLVQVRDDQWRLAGLIDDIAVEGIHVPFALRAALDALRSADRPRAEALAPRYEVQIAVGQHLEPWIETVSLLPGTSPPEMTPQR